MTVSCQNRVFKILDYFEFTRHEVSKSLDDILATICWNKRLKPILADDLCGGAPQNLTSLLIDQGDPLVFIDDYKDDPNNVQILLRFVSCRFQLGSTRFYLFFKMFAVSGPRCAAAHLSP